MLNDQHPLPIDGFACDLIVDDAPRSGDRNMALDAALLHTGLSSSRCCVRIYRWSEPTISVGHFQNTETAGAGMTASLPHVRRLTGGGAILHDQEITYSCILPDIHPVRHDPSRLYRVMHIKIIELLSECGVNSRLRSCPGDHVRMAKPNGSPSQEPFLCFLRTDPNDIVCDVFDQHTHILATHKIVGSAQRRRRGTILQHGSILLSASPHAPNVAGIRQLFSGFLEDQFCQALGVSLAAAIAASITVRNFSAEEDQFADNWAS